MNHPHLSSLYDTHYTERFMDTPQNNPEGYKVGCVLNYVKGYPAGYVEDSFASSSDKPITCLRRNDVMLKLTHGTGDDNVHFQNTLQLIDALQKEGRKFEFMIYPDGMHGYRGYQGVHSKAADRDFWRRWLL